MPIIRKPLPPLELLKLLFWVDIERGWLMWRDTEFVSRFLGINKHLVGQRAGCEHRNKKGYGHRVIGIKGELFKEHNIIYALLNNGLPDDMKIDHIDGDATNNKPSNFKLIPFIGGYNEQNQKKRTDNTSGHTGVSHTIHNQTKIPYWIVRIGQGKKFHTKYFSITKYGNDFAYQMACDYADKLYKEFGFSETHGKR